ncbi:MAG: histidine phosphatase family protein, partial [Clostridia bacterium]|nr:histidine phosphatase family protein [Clostridia bacterium]
MKVYVMRHGKTVWNEKNRIQGLSRNRLSKTGDELVKIVAERYKNVQFDVIFASPLMRTMQTANIMNSYHNV